MGAVVLPVPRELPEARAEDVGGHHLTEAPCLVLALWGWGTSAYPQGAACTPWWRLRGNGAQHCPQQFVEEGDDTRATQGALGPYPDEVDEGVVDVGTTGQEEAAARAECMEEEEFLFL